MILNNATLWQYLLMWGLAASMATATAILLKRTFRAKGNKAPHDVAENIMIITYLVAKVEGAVAIKH